VARDLLGRLLVKLPDDPGDEPLVGRIVETEAYQEDDPASHSFGGPRRRNLVMFGAPGHVYVYFTYGMHHCMNVVTGPPGRGSAVLLRAVEPLQGLGAMAAGRGLADALLLCSGPARLTQAYGVNASHDGIELSTASGLWVSAGRPVRDAAVAVGPRIGIRVAVDQPWRFWVRGNPFVSGGRARKAVGGAAGAMEEAVELSEARRRPR
jgi:DNA-3-methyladenine glycosylase